MPLGAEVLPSGRVTFSVWAPRPREVSLRIVDGAGDRPTDVPMTRGAGDVWSVTVDRDVARAGTRYAFVLDGDRARPDPRSRCQPDGVHGPSMVIDPSTFRWRHPAPRGEGGGPDPASPVGRGRESRGPSIESWVIYELHVGTFTRQGTFAAAAARLPRVAELGVTAIEIMPVSAFAGARNWGYDGVHPFAPAAAYGPPDDLRALVDEAHRLGLAVLMDVVYNHLGPEGNYTSEYAPYVTEAHQTPWGGALDYARREVRDWAIDNALTWLREYRVDGLRVDALHAIVDESPTHILAELCARARPAALIAETDMNDPVVFEWGFDACWSDDFHHALHAVLTGERGGYYRDFGDLATLARAIEQGWTRGVKAHRSRELAGGRLVIGSQNHDQIGNRARGERLEHLAGAAAARLAAVATLTAPGVPLLFMGEEWGASTPFQYFTSHEDPGLAAAVADGRRGEFASFAWQGEVPDPQDPRTFERSRLDWRERERPPHAARLRLYRDLIALRRARPALGARGKQEARARVEGGAIVVERSEALRVVLNLDRERPFALDRTFGRAFTTLLCSEDARYGGALSAGVNDGARELPPLSAAVLERR
jgi:maltooligosyltrehalose trehalohydrolase